MDTSSKNFQHPSPKQRHQHLCFEHVNWFRIVSNVGLWYQLCRTLVMCYPRVSYSINSLVNQLNGWIILKYRLGQITVTSHYVVYEDNFETLCLL